ncbi:MAG TPA: hypothetical protein VKV04_02575, partial [Verrucomicrobiae bacterium]|nr:hypothetical protein [Verrucomicrobiae bacterium]
VAVDALPPLETAFHAGVNTKNVAIAAAVAMARLFNAIIQAFPGVTDAMLESAGLPVHDSTRTPNPPPATEPILNVSSPLHGTIRFVVHDSAAPDSHSHAKPAGYQGFELFEQIGGTPPVTSAGMTPLNIQTKTSFTFTEDPANAGKTFYYLARWVNTTGEPGPWSAVVSVVLS